jgi:hypothetical protein
MKLDEDALLWLEAACKQLDANPDGALRIQKNFPPGLQFVAVEKDLLRELIAATREKLKNEH